MLKMPTTIEVQAVLVNNLSFMLLWERDNIISISVFATHCCSLPGPSPGSESKQNSAQCFDLLGGVHWVHSLYAPEHFLALVSCSLFALFV
jgi:hypothetical protein